MSLDRHQHLREKLGNIRSRAEEGRGLGPPPHAWDGISGRPGHDDLRIRKQLSRIARQHGLVIPAEGRYHFDHGKIREVLYEGIPIDLRRAYHGSVATCLIEATTGSHWASEFTIAYHLDVAKDPRAYDHALQAAEEARASFATEEARSCYAIARRYAQETAQELAVLEGLGALATMEGDSLATIDYLVEAEPLASEGPARASILLSRAKALITLGRSREALDLIETAIETVDVGSDEWIRLRIAKGSASVSGDSLATAEIIINDAIERSPLDSELRAEGLYNLGLARILGGQVEPATEPLVQAAELFAATGNRLGRSEALHWLGYVHYKHGHYQEALEIVSQGRQLSEEIGAHRTEAVSLITIGYLHYELGDLESGLESHRGSLQICQGTGDPRALAHALGAMAEGLLRYGKFDEADEMNRAALVKDREGDYPEAGGPLLVRQGRIKAARGQPFQEDFEAGLARIEAGTANLAEAQVQYAQALEESDPEKACKCLDEACSTFARFGNEVWTERIGKVLKQLGR